MALLNLLLTLCFTGLVLSQTPIPTRPPGYVFQSSTGEPEVVVEAFYDHLCDDSKANYPTLIQVRTAYTGKPVKILIHIFPLPYHHNAYFMQQAGEVVRNISYLNFENYLDAAFEDQDQFLEGAVDLTEPLVKQKIALFTEANTEVSSSTVLKGFDDGVIVRRSRYAWKYAAHRGITGTPQFIINGVHYPDASDFTIEEWTKCIDNLMQNP